MRSMMLLMAAIFLAALLGQASAGGSQNSCGNLAGKWQGTCVFKGYNKSCAEDIITVPYYMEYKYDSYSDKCKVWYKRDSTFIKTCTKWDGSNNYTLPCYADSGYCKLSSSGDGYCADCWYDKYQKRTYRAQYKHYGDLNVIVEEGWMQNTNSWYDGVYGKCPSYSWKSLSCDNYQYTYRCYLVKTGGWNWKW